MLLDSHEGFAAVLEEIADVELKAPHVVVCAVAHLFGGFFVREGYEYAQIDGFRLGVLVEKRVWRSLHEEHEVFKQGVKLEGPEVSLIREHFEVVDLAYSELQLLLATLKLLYQALDFALRVLNESERLGDVLLWLHVQPPISFKIITLTQDSSRIAGDKTYFNGFSAESSEIGPWVFPLSQVQTVA